MKDIVLLASGSGSNVENIIHHFQGHQKVRIASVLTNNAKAKVIERCERLQVPLLYFNKMAFSQSDTVLKLLQSLNPELIILAGFLWKIPEEWVVAFDKKIINIHPALLPKYGGKGMYGSHVHSAVKASREKETGITIHYVNKHYEEGAIIFQAKTPLEEADTVEAIARKVHQLEYEYYPKVIEQLLQSHG